jgi:hypothetical protein
MKISGQLAAYKRKDFGQKAAKLNSYVITDTYNQDNAMVALNLPGTSLVHTNYQDRDSKPRKSLNILSFYGATQH